MLPCESAVIPSGFGDPGGNDAKLCTLPRSHATACSGRASNSKTADTMRSTVMDTSLGEDAHAAGVACVRGRQPVAGVPAAGQMRGIDESRRVRDLGQRPPAQAQLRGGKVL